MPFDESPRLRLDALILAGALCIRLLLEVVFLLPSPVGDSVFFITASANSCFSGFLGTTVYPIDPTGQARMVWHGFVSPMLFSAVDAGCSARGLYLTLWIIKALTAAGVLTLARIRRLPPGPALGLGLLALAAQTGMQFRPESLAVLLIVVAEIVIALDAALVLGVILGTLLCTQPTVAGLYGLLMLALRPGLLRRWQSVGLGAVAAVVLLLSLYPFPAVDLVDGIRLQAKRLIGRDDGGVFTYYLLTPALPLWGILLAVATALAARRRPWVVLMVPFFWFFGPRVPPVFYNLVPSCIVLVWFVIAEKDRTPTSRFLVAASMAVGAFGLCMLSVRDGMTAARYGNTFAATSAEVAKLAAEGGRIGDAAPFLTLTNPPLRLTEPHQPPLAPGPDPSGVALVAVNGAPVSPCPGAPGNPEQVSLTIGGHEVFHSNSGWMVYVCPSP